MKIAGFFSLFAGWLLVLAAVVMLPSGMTRNAFAVAGLAVEATGMVLAVRSHMRPPQRKSGARDY